MLTAICKVLQSNFFGGKSKQEFFGVRVSGRLCPKAMLCTETLA
jgi:hypothetical protein